MFFTLPSSTIVTLAREDSVFETLGAILFAISSILCFFLFFQSTQGNDLYLFRTNKNIFFLLLALLFLFAFGEEINWGQRIVGVATPGLFHEINMQNEVNIHNLAIFRSVSVNRLFSVFWFAYCVIVPFLSIISSNFLELTKKINFPVVSVSLGVMFMINSGVSRFVNIYIPSNLHHYLIEVKECNFGVLFFAVTLWFFTGSRKFKRA